MIRFLGKLLRKTAGRTTADMLAGMVDYYRFPEKRAGWGGPFNGQKSRQALFRELQGTTRPAMLVETGTHLGTTAEYLAGFKRPVFTVEGEARNYGFSRMRLRRLGNVTLVHGDSRVFLRKLLAGSGLLRPDDALFAYLDAHWNEDLPLAEELDIVFSSCPKAIAMIDDFEVPGDPGYGFDDYGPGKALTLSYVAPALARFGLAAYVPACRASKETGARRGCAVLAGREVHAPALDKLALLRRVA